MANFVSSSGGPIRPPRTFKTTKDSNGLLISVIRSLSASQSSADRDKEKAKLEKEFKRSDQKLDDLVAQNKEDLTKAMQDFSKISSKISMSREKIHSIKEKLTTCKVLLHCKRDELKKLWLEAIEHKHVLQLLEEIESLVEVPDKVNTFLNKKQYLHATKLLVSSVALVEGSLEGVEALKDVKAKLIYKKEHMHEVLVDELHRHLYLRTTNEALQTFRRQGSDRRLQGVASPSAGKTAARNPSSSSLVNGCIGDGGKGVATCEDNLDLLKLEEDGIVDSSLLSSKYIAILVQCLVLLNKIPEMIETIKERCESELLSIVWRTTQFLLDSGQNLSNQPSVSQSRLLLDLLDLLFEQFRCVVAGHECILANVHRVTVSQNPENEVVTYSVADIWTRVQSVMEYVVGKYLDIDNTGSAQQAPPPAFSEVVATNDIASYFTRRRNVKQKKFALFRFDCSSHAISMNTYLKEKKEEMKSECDYVEVGDSRQRLVCAPTSKNITYIFKPLMSFIGEIEVVLKREDGTHCDLYEYLVKCVKCFLTHIGNDLENTIDNATKSLETWKVISDSEILRQHGGQRPLLQSTLCVDHSLQGLQELMQALPMYRDHFLSLASNILQSYKETSQAAYRGVVQPESEDKRIISATWAKDEDICRFLMSLPNWANLQHLKENKGSVDVEESPEEVRLRNKKESEILIGNLAGGTLIPQHEILSDTTQLKVLAQLQESLEWLSSRILATANCGLQAQQQKNLGLSPVSCKTGVQDSSFLQETAVQMLRDLARDFQEIADTCLLVLHLEVRVHCFYYLLPVTVQANFAIGVDSQEPDPEVMRLNKDLAAIDEAMNSCLQQRKHRYIFEGLGHLIASILINSTSSIQRVNENGVKKVCRNIFAIQQNLTGITMNREVALDHARQYFELFYHTPEDVLNLIVEHGSQFQEAEYKNVLQLLHRSLPSTDRDPDALDALLSRLGDILNEVAVAV